MNKQLLLLVVFTGGMSIKCFSQGTDMGLEKKPGAFIGITAGTVKSTIVNESSLDLEEVTSSDKMIFSGSLDIGFMFSKSFGIKSGLGYSSCDVQLALDSYKDSLNLKDSELESYILRVTASDISETQSLSILRIPLTVVLKIPLSNVVSIFIEPGINITLPLNTNFSNSGLFTYKGYYPEYNVVFENLPTHGFSGNTTVKGEDGLELKQMWSEAVVYAGISIVAKRNFHVDAGVNYSRSISDISEYKSTGIFHLCPAPGLVSSLMGGSSKVSTKSLGFSVTLRYFINR